MGTMTLVRERRRAASPHSEFARHVAFVLLGAGALLFVGTLVDLGILWIAQRQPAAQWEFVAVTNTLESFPRLALGLALFAGALYLSRSESLVSYRIVAGAVLLLGLAGGLLGVMIATDYFAVRGTMPGEAQPLLRSTTWKAMALSAVYFGVLAPLGVLGLRRPSR